jgi:CheY-like chemotaxis protein
VVWARSGEQAPEELARHPVRLVVLDIGLPGVGPGFEVCRRLRSRTGVPILILSARDEEVDRVAGRAVELARGGEFRVAPAPSTPTSPQLRAKLGLPGFIATVRGAGYKPSSASTSAPAPATARPRAPASASRSSAS